DLKADAPPAKEQQRFAIGFVGRVVPIKDVKTFIRACKIVHMRFGRVQAYVMGPTEEDENYFKECRELVRLMRLEAVVHFTGKVEVRKYYPSLDAVVLTSISEAQPLVIMEANCAGIPAVASDVGACRELIEGRTEEDRALGPSGLVTKVADPVDTAEAILKILTDARLRTAMSEAGKKRIARYYRESELIGRYLEAYRLQMAAPDAEAV
ncbi:MAG: GT4 family glycosyltransferase PelF, partial [Desulfovibrionaceae bacterium]|nr:GT4 family glycosyltransferase PelF [Desulfovibrionaceae bacterium]